MKIKILWIRMKSSCYKLKFNVFSLTLIFILPHGAMGTTLYIRKLKKVSRNQQGSINGII